MRTIPFLVVVALLLVGCAVSTTDRLSQEYIHGYLAWRPATGTSLGLHEYDGKVTDYSRASIDAERERLIQFRERFAALSTSDREARMVRASIEDELLEFDVADAFARNPMTYAGAFDLSVYAKRDFAPKRDRLKSVVAVLDRVPETMARARENLRPNLPRPFIKTAIEQANGSAEFFTEDLVVAFEEVKEPALQSDFKRAREAAAKAMTDFAQWLEHEKQPTATDDFAIGREGYARMLRDGGMLPLPPEHVLDVAMRELKREQTAFAEAAKRIDPTKPPIEVFKAIQRDHPTESSLIPDTVKHLEMIRKFVIDHDLVSFPSMVPVKVEETPKFDRATSFASMDSPGPFERATEAFYYVTPTEPEWDAKRKDEWLTSFNYYTTDVVTIHEAYPGHYVQFLHLKSSGATRAEKMFGNYAFIEGWAHYCEQMVLDEGFPGANADELTRAKYRLAQSSEALLRLCRLCVSVKMHCQGMSVADAKRFFMDNAYYEEAPALAEAERGTYDPGYGFYTLGKLQILKLREDYKKQEGANFNLKKFHDTLLDHGQGPIRLLRERTLKDPKVWDELL